MRRKDIRASCCDEGRKIQWQPEYGRNLQHLCGWALHAEVDGGFLDVWWDDLKFCPWCGRELKDPRHTRDEDE